MPRADLTEEQNARVRAGLCACGCGEKLPTVRDWNGERVPYGTLYMGNAHRQRAFRERARAGRVVRRPERARAELVKRAAELRRQAELEDYQVKIHREAAARLRREADQLEREAAGQTQIPGFPEVTAAPPAAPVTRKGRCAVCGRPCNGDRVQVRLRNVDPSYARTWIRLCDVHAQTAYDNPGASIESLRQARRKLVASSGEPSAELVALQEAADRAWAELLRAPPREAP